MEVLNYNDIKYDFIEYSYCRVTDLAEREKYTKKFIKKEIY